MEELNVNNHLQKEDLFDLFKRQLKKDFEGAGLNGDFTEKLPADFDSMSRQLVSELEPLLKVNSFLISSLLYRVDLSEMQVQAYQEKNPGLPFGQLLSELLIKRTLQKVILRKKFSP
jgi:hypothetical protein